VHAGDGNDAHDWAWLQDRMKEGDMITLDKDYTDSEGEGELLVPEDKNVLLDLNRHKIDRDQRY
jgi:hypothetical protein